MAVSLLLIGIALTACAAALHFFAARDLRDLNAGAARLAEWLRERTRIETQLEQLRRVQSTAENTIAAGTSTVQAAHRLIAAIPFGILEAIPVTRDTTRIVRTLHDQISKVVYGSIAGTNQVVGKALRQGLAQSEETADPTKPETLPKARKARDDRSKNKDGG